MNDLSPSRDRQGLSSVSCFFTIAGRPIKEQTCEFPLLFIATVVFFIKSTNISTASPLLALLLCTELHVVYCHNSVKELL